MPKGTVKHVRPDQNFGFITPEDGSAGVHFNLRGVPEPLLVEGAEVEYTLGKSKPGQSPHADKVWGSTDSVANAPPAATTSPPTKKSVTPSQNIAVGFVIGEPLSWVTTEGRQKKEWVRLPVWVVVTKLGNPVVSEEVKLDAEGVPVVQGIEKAYTLSDGKAFFPALLKAGSTSGHLVATVAGNTYSYFWQKEKEVPKVETPEALPTPEPTPVPPPEPPKPTEPPKVQKLRQTADGVYTFLVQTTPNTEVTLNGISVTNKGPFTSDAKGELEVQVKVEKEADRGDLIFCVGGFQSKPQYIVHPTRPQK